MNTGITDILKARASSYGSYALVSKITLDIISAFEDGKNWHNLDAAAKVSLIMVANKLARIVNGSLKEDSLKDIQGYIQLILDNSQDITT